jgi:hypothetical protein
VGQDRFHWKRVKKSKAFMTVTFMTVIKTLLVTAATAVLTSTGLATSYEELVKNGYRWAAIDGPFACPAKSDVPVIVKNADNDELRLHMVEQLRAYYLVRGTIVKVLNEEPAAGLAEIQIAGIIPELWTLSRFLSRQPIPDLYGSIETPAAADFAAPMVHLPGTANP